MEDEIGECALCKNARARDFVTTRPTSMTSFIRLVSLAMRLTSEVRATLGPALALGTSQCMNRGCFTLTMRSDPPRMVRCILASTTTARPVGSGPTRVKF
jgi:hypothetical protein